MDIEEIKARLAAASKGPWHATRAASQVIRRFKWVSQDYIAEDDCILDGDNNEILGCSEWMRVDWENLEFMAHARKDIEDFISTTEAMQAKLDAQAKEIEALRGFAEYVLHRIGIYDKAAIKFNLYDKNGNPTKLLTGE